MDTDITPVPYVVLVTRIIERCYSDWTHFCHRTKKDGNANSSRLRLALAQFCRHQREIFLKLRTLHPFVRSQTQASLNRLLQDAVTAQQVLPNITNYINQTLWSTRESLLQLGLMAPPPNLSVAVDVLSTKNYTRLPVLLDQTIKMADTGDIQLIDYGISEFDLVKRRLEDEYLVSFKRSSVPKDRVELLFINGHADFVVKDYFSVSIIYDLTRWQVLKAVLTITDELNVEDKGLLNDSFLQLISATVFLVDNPNETDQTVFIENDAANNVKNRVSNVDIFVKIFVVGMRFCTKLALEHLREQAISYKSNSNKISNINFLCDNKPIINCFDVFSGTIVLNIEISRTQSIIGGDCQSLEDLFQSLNTLSFSFNIDEETNQLSKTQFPFNIFINKLGDDLNEKLLQKYVNKGDVKPFQLHYWINFLYFVLETLMFELLNNIFMGNANTLTVKEQIQSANVPSLSIYDQGQYLGYLYFSRFTGNISFKLSNNLTWIGKLTKKLIAFEAATSINAFVSLLCLVVSLNKLYTFKTSQITEFQRIYPLEDNLLVEMLEKQFNGRMIYGELHETDATEALLFDGKCYQIGSAVFSLHKSGNQLFAIATKQLQPPEIIKL